VTAISLTGLQSKARPPLPVKGEIMAELDLSRLEGLQEADRVRVEKELERTLDRQIGIIDAPLRPVRDRNSFQQALVKLSSDPEYRTAATQDPGLITSDFKLSLKELQALRQVAVLSGADVKVVDKFRVDSINRGVNALDSVDVSCCSCCCCCCGDTAVSISG
jgi:hypothetical protein